MATGKRNAAARGFAHSFSSYIAWLIDRDAAGAIARERLDAHNYREHLRVAEHPPPEQGKSSG